ncbi:srf-tf-domain-containing protein [Phaffia rhodozyma]|uniref:Srf-tf-domain-containing protein n=1 Tax=Phaffia rhodozyma TaxID=264483 RepID=A0A0F7SNQ8_PHARH|nr:srf-tf-domain-containing protein [Phaffia rhodozyma]
MEEDMEDDVYERRAESSATSSTVDKPMISLDEGVTFETGLSGDEDDEDDGDGPRKKTRTNSGDSQGGRRSIHIEYIENKARRHITFSKRRAGIMKKAYELSVLTGTQVLLLVVSETGLVYTYTTPKLEPLVTQTEGKNLIQACLNAPEGVAPGGEPLGSGGMTTGARSKAKLRSSNQGAAIRHKDELVVPPRPTISSPQNFVDPNSATLNVSDKPLSHLPKQSTPLKPKAKPSSARKPPSSSSSTRRPKKNAQRSPSPTSTHTSLPEPINHLIGSEFSEDGRKTPPITEDMLHAVEQAKMRQMKEEGPGQPGEYRPLPPHSSYLQPQHQQLYDQHLQPSAGFHLPPDQAPSQQQQQAQLRNQPNIPPPNSHQHNPHQSHSHSQQIHPYYHPDRSNSYSNHTSPANTVEEAPPAMAAQTDGYGYTIERDGQDIGAWGT